MQPTRGNNALAYASLVEINSSIEYLGVLGLKGLKKGWHWHLQGSINIS